jgi:DNA-binding FadR family transcriptional regulator
VLDLRRKLAHAGASAVGIEIMLLQRLLLAELDVLEHPLRRARRIVAGAAASYSPATRKALESYAAAKAARRASAEDIERLERICDAIRMSAGGIG